MNATPSRSLGSAAAVLTPALLNRLHELNLDFLELILLPGNEQRFSTRHGACALLAHCSRDELQAIASASFTLYSLGFDDPLTWRSMWLPSHEPIAKRYAPMHMSTLSAFCEAAMFHAWHTAVTSPVAARLVYGMPTTIVDTLARAQFWQLRHLAQALPRILAPRWPANPVFWPETIRFARTLDRRRLCAVHQFGHQLLALDLQSSESPVASRQRNVRLSSPRKMR